MRQKPKVSVIMPTYNRSGMIKNAIRSVLRQDLKDFELVIVNDGSTDNTEKVILGFRDPRVKYLCKKNGGPASARNVGISAARGKYISYLDDDDIYYPCHLKLLSRFLDRHKKIGLVYADVHFRINNKTFIPYSFDFSEEKLEVDNIIPYNSLMHRRGCIRKTGFFDEDLPVAMDWDLWMRISDDYNITHLKQIVAQVRFHGNNRTVTTGNYHEWYVRIIKKRLFARKRLFEKPFFSNSYYTGIAYRLLYKFKVERERCVKIMNEIAGRDKAEPAVFWAQVFAKSQGCCLKERKRMP